MLFMKKMIALLLALTLLLASPALAATQYGVWTIEITDLSVTVDGETVEAEDASIVVRFGFTEDRGDAWLMAEIKGNGRTVAAFMAEEDESGLSRLAYSEGDTCARLKKGGWHAVLMENLGFEKDEVPKALSGAVDMLDALLARPKGVVYLFSQLGSAKTLKKNRYAVSVELPGGELAGTLKWSWERRAKKPFDLGDRADADYNPAKGLDSVEGFAQARAALEEKLLDDETLADITVAATLLLDL